MLPVDDVVRSSNPRVLWRRIGLTQVSDAMQEADIADAVPRMLELTRTLVPLLLESDDPRLAILRQQWTAASVTIAAPSYWGFFAEFSVPPEVPRVDTANRCDGNAHIPWSTWKLPSNPRAASFMWRVAFWLILRCTPPSDGPGHPYSVLRSTLSRLRSKPQMPVRAAAPDASSGPANPG